MLKLRLLLISIIAIVGFFIAPVAVKGQTVILSLEPSSSSYTVGDSFNIVIKLDTGSSNTDGVDIHYLNYNPLLLEAQTVLPGALYANTNTNNIDAVNGRIDFSQTSAGGATFNGQGTLATITFKALSQGTANLTFSFTLGSTIDTNVAFLGQDVLSNVVNSSYTLVVPDITPPTGCVVKINNDAAAASSTSVFLTVSGCTDASGMDQMKFSNNGIDGWSTPENYVNNAVKSWIFSAGDSANKRIYVQFSDALGNWTGNIVDSIKLDTTAPTNGAISINSGAVATNSRTVTLTNISATDALSTVTQMRFSNDNVDWSSAPITYAATASWTLSISDGIKTVYVKFKDSLENWSGVFSDNITLDATAPVRSNSAPSGELEATITQAVISLSTNENATCKYSATAGTAYGSMTNTFSGAGTQSHSTQITGLSKGNTYNYYVRCQDSLDNTNTSDAVITFSIEDDTDAPSGCVVQINNNQLITNNQAVSIKVSNCYDPNGVSQIQYSDTGTSSWSTAENYVNNAVKSWTFAAGDSVSKTIYVRVSDNLNNWSGSFTDVIILDTAPPANASITIIDDNGYINTRQVALELFAEDALSGLDQMQISGGAGVLPVEPYATSKSLTITQEEGAIIFNVKFRDQAGNWTDTVSAEIILDETEPTIIHTPATDMQINISTAEIHWTTNENTSAQVAFGLTDQYGNLSALDSTFDLDQTITLTGLETDKTYHYQLIAVDQAGNQTKSSDYTFQTEMALDITAPAKITDLSSSAQTINTVTLTWIAPGDDGAQGRADSYNIRYSTANITADNFTQATAAPGISTFNPKIAGETEVFIITGLSASTKYYFAIKTSDEVPNVSELSNVISATTLAVAPTPPPSSSGGGGGYVPPSDTTAPAKPAEFKAVSSETQIGLSWKNPKDADFVRVKILRKEDKYPANSTDGQVIYEGNKESFIDKDLKTDKTYYYAIFACDGAPNWSEPAILKITVSTAPQVSEPEPETEPKAGEMTREEKIIWLKEQIKVISAKIALLQAKLTELLGKAPAKFEKNLTYGNRGDNVVKLQEILIKQDCLKTGLNTGLFGLLTYKAVSCFQEKYASEILHPFGLTNGTGFVGPSTRTKLNELVK